MLVRCKKCFGNGCEICKEKGYINKVITELISPKTPDYNTTTTSFNQWHYGGTTSDSKL